MLTSVTSSRTTRRRADTLGSAEKINIVEEEVGVMLFEPTSTLNTGNVTGEMTVAELDRI